VEFAKTSEQAQRTLGRLRQTNQSIEAIALQVLKGEATDADEARLRSHRGLLESELKAQREALEEISPRREALSRAYGHLRDQVQAEARRAAVVAFKPIVDEMAARLRELSALNEVLYENWPGITGIPSAIPELRIVCGSGRLFHWLKEADTFDWGAYGA
jgi:hypothetical protein